MSQPKLDDVRQEYDRLAGEYDDRWPTYLGASTRETLMRLSLRPGDWLLDVGCGTGLLLDRIRSEWPAVKIVGIDLSRGMLARAGERLRGEAALAQADAGKLPFAADSFDVVVSSNSLHFWPDPVAALAEAARVLRPSGRLVITDWCGDYLACRVLDLFLRLTGRAYERVYRSAELATLLEEAGFRGVAVDRYRLNWFWHLMTATAAATPPNRTDRETLG